MIYEWVDVNFKDKNNILFIVVCEGGYLSVVEILMKVGVNVNFRDGEKIFFIVVCNSGWYDVVKRLIKVKVEVN